MTLIYGLVVSLVKSLQLDFTFYLMNSLCLFIEFMASACLLLLSVFLCEYFLFISKIVTCMSLCQDTVPSCPPCVPLPYSPSCPYALAALFPFWVLAYLGVTATVFSWESDRPLIVWLLGHLLGLFLLFSEFFPSGLFAMCVSFWGRPSRTFCVSMSWSLPLMWMPAGQM